MHKASICIGYLLFFNSVAGSSFDCIGKPFKDFLECMVHQADHSAFEKYYQDFIEQQKIQKIQHAQKNKLFLEELRKAGLAPLEVKYPQDTQELLLKEPNDVAVNTFLIRYAKYQDFLNQKMQGQTSIWVRVRNYGYSLKNQIINWFNAWKKSSEEIV